MTEQELRTVVREAIARNAWKAPASNSGRVPVIGATPHASHGMFVVQAGADQDGPCIIEPAVPCNHCGYCKSYGH